MNIRHRLCRFLRLISGFGDSRHRTENPCVGGSIPPSATKFNHLDRPPQCRRLISGPVSNIQWFRAALDALILLLGLAAFVGLFLCDGGVAR